jgi:hypothetical protein
MRCVFALCAPAVLAALAAVPVGAADEPPSNKEITTSANNMKQFGIAHYNYYDVTGAMATDIVDKNGKALLSWRVQLLPYLEQDHIYKQFKLDEPWDSADNKKLIAMMPKVYAPIRVKAKEGETFYQCFTGKDALFGAGKKVSLAGIADGTSNTIIAIEAGDPVIWTKPADIAYDEKKPLPKLGGMFDGNFHIGLADGSVMWVRKGFDEKTLRGAITPAGGEVLDMKKLTKRE